MRGPADPKPGRREVLVRKVPVPHGHTRRYEVSLTPSEGAALGGGAGSKPGARAGLRGIYLREPKDTLAASAFTATLTPKVHEVSGGRRSLALVPAVPPPTPQALMRLSEGGARRAMRLSEGGVASCGPTQHLPEPATHTHAHMRALSPCGCGFAPPRSDPH